MLKRVFSRKNVALAILILACGIMYLMSSSDSKDTWQVLSDTEVISSSLEREEMKSLDEQTMDVTAESITEEMSMVFVHVSGAVKSPGVYQVKTGSRIYQVIDLAGGLTEDADREFLNMAQTVADGQKITVYTREEVESGNISEGSDSIIENSNRVENKKININTADKETLMELAGIGEAKADAILAYRMEHGKFQTIEDIMEVPGIKSAAFEKIKDSIIV